MTDVDPVEPVPVGDAATGVAGWGAVAAALLSVALVGLSAWSSLALGAAGVALLAVGLATDDRRAVTAAGAGLVAGGLAAGLAGAPALVALGGVTLGVVAWDLGHRAVVLGRQLGRSADTRRLEGVQVAASLGVGLVTAGLGFGVYRSAAGGQPVAALAFLVVAAALAAAALS